MGARFCHPSSLSTPKIVAPTKVVKILGPSDAGKTTFIKQCELLAGINIDDTSEFLMQLAICTLAQRFYPPGTRLAMDNHGFLTGPCFRKFCHDWRCGDNYTVETHGIMTYLVRNVDRLSRRPIELVDEDYVHLSLPTVGKAKTDVELFGTRIEFWEISGWHVYESRWSEFLLTDPRPDITLFMVPYTNDHDALGGYVSMFLKTGVLGIQGLICVLITGANDREVDEMQHTLLSIFPNNRKVYCFSLDVFDRAEVSVLVNLLLKLT